VITAGSLATLLGSTAAGAGLGAATGGIIGALVSEGIPEEDAHVYAEGVRRGGILLKVTVDDQLAPEVMNAMERANVVDVAARRDEWQRGGWEYFDESATPSPGDIRYGGIRAV
jgi:uncharacterized membrane protein